MPQQILGDKSVEVHGLAPSLSAQSQDLTFVTKPELLAEIKSTVVFCPETVSKELPNKTLICVKNPKLAFVRVANSLFKIPNPRITIGKNVYLAEGVVIGSEGFGYVRNEVGELEKFPHIGGIVIGDNVDLGANTSVDRGSLEDTVIGSGSKLDNLVHVAHNVKIGKHCLITAHVFLGGSCVVEDYATIWAGAIIFDHVRIGHHAEVGAGAVVRKDVKPYEIVAGNPARNIEELRQHGSDKKITLKHGIVSDTQY